jgi:hypothetical protein
MRFDEYDDLVRHMEINHPEIHRSEWEWRLTKRNHIIRNDSTLADLKHKVSIIISQ